MTERAGNQSGKQITRRAFVQRTSAAAAVGAFSAGLSVARGAHAAGGETLKIALIGCGGRGTGAAVQALSTEGPVTLWAMADLFPEKLETSLAGLTKGQKANYDRKGHEGFGSRIDVPPERRFVGFDAYQKAIDTGVDVVILTTQPHFRPIHFEYAVQQGKHVFMEKPVATDVPGVRRVLAANEVAKQKNLKVGVGFQRHHDASYLETVKRLRDGAVGEILVQQCYWNSSGARPPVARDPSMTEMLFQMRNPYYFTWISGDHIVEQHCHNPDVCNWLKGTYPVSAQGQGGREVRTGREYGDIFDHHFVEFTYADGTQMFSQCRQIPNCWNYVGEQVVGTKGKADVGGGRIEVAGDAWRYRGPKVNPYQIEHDDLFAAIRNDRPYNEADYGATSTMTAILGRMATYSGRVVTWDEAINSQISLAPDHYDWNGVPSTLPNPDGSYPHAIPGVTRVV